MIFYKWGVYMGLNDTPLGSRFQIGLFGRTNAGKSSLANTITGQDLAIVSDRKGTTTDPVTKTMELLPIGPVAVTDTPGFDDNSELGALRIEKTKEIMSRIDMGLVVFDAAAEDDPVFIRNIIKDLERRKCPSVIVANKIDQLSGKAKLRELEEAFKGHTFLGVSCLSGEGIEELKALIGKLWKEVEEDKQERKIVSDLIEPGDTVILVIPIDSSAPKGRIILPQQQTLRDILDAGGNALCIKDTELKELFDNNPGWTDPSSTSAGICRRPSLVITDSQVFKEVDAIVPKSIRLTSFSILMARYKGELDWQMSGAESIDSLEDGDRVLVAEGCTHHRQCDDIGTVKLPRLIRRYTGKDIELDSTSGHGYPKDLSRYKMIFHCGSCMLGENEVRARVGLAREQNIPITNYGMAIAYMNGILNRATAVFLEKKD